MPEVALDSDYYRYLQTETQKLPPEFDIFPRRQDYATAPLQDGIDLEGLLSRLSATRGLQYGEKFGWAFRSDKRPEIDNALITQFDTPAHQEARLAKGYDYYFKGPILVANSCMSFCFWETPNDAHRATAGPAHQAAVAMAPVFYKSFILEHFSLDYRPTGVTITELMPPLLRQFE